MNTQDYLRSGKTFEDLTSELGINVTKHDTLPLVILNYDQIESPKTHPIVRECRGLVLNSENYSLVARAFSRFYNWGEVAEEMPLFDWKTCIADEKVDGCFHHSTKLNLWNGGTISIGEVVNKKLKVTLIGMKDGLVVPCEVTNWYDNGTKDNWLSLEVDCFVNRGKGKTNKIKVTTNHSFFLNDKWQPIGNAKRGDKLTTLDYRPSDSCLRVMRASLLGDASICASYGSFRFSDGHVQRDAQFNLHILRWLGECAIKQRTVVSGYGSFIIQNTSKCYNYLETLRNEWYPKGEKVVPADLTWVDDFAVAKWYMDDGNLSHSDGQQDRAIFSTHGFSQADVQRLCDLLHAKYGVDAVASYSKGWYIRVNSGYKNEIDKLWQAIAPHVLPDMRYKLPKQYKNVAYQAYPNGEEITFNVSCTIKNVIVLANTKTNFPHGRKGFDIETTTHNYFAKNVLVHNSLVLIYNFEGTWLANTRGSFAGWPMFDEYKAKFYGVPIDFKWSDAILKALNVNSLDELCLDSSCTYVCELCSLWNKVVREYKTPCMYQLTRFVGEEEIGPVEHPAFRTLGRYPLGRVEDVQNFVQDHPEATFEGIVIKDNEFHRWKLKNPRYVSLHRLKGNGDNLFQPKYLMPFILSGEGDELLTYFPEVENVFTEYKAKVESAYKELEAVWNANHTIPVQKDFALAIAGKTPFTGLLFQQRKSQIALKKLWLDAGELILRNLF